MDESYEARSPVWSVYLRLMFTSAIGASSSSPLHTPRYLLNTSAVWTSQFNLDIPSPHCRWIYAAAFSGTGWLVCLGGSHPTPSVILAMTFNSAPGNTPVNLHNHTSTHVVPSSRNIDMGWFEFCQTTPAPPSLGSHEKCKINAIPTMTCHPVEYPSHLAMLAPLTRGKSTISARHTPDIGPTLSVLFLGARIDVEVRGKGHTARPPTTPDAMHP